MDKRVSEIIAQSKSAGWVLEPLAKELLNIYGLTTSRFFWAKTKDEAISGAKEIGYPLVAKIVSPEVVHKSDVGGVVVGVKDDEELLEVFEKLSKLPAFDGVLLDAMAKGSEVIIGSKHDPQFGATVLIGIGGTSVEIYKDVAIRMAPISCEEALEALNSLRGHKLLEGYRGAECVNFDHLTDMIARFSQMVYELSDEIESIDLNPVLCNCETSTIADARIILK